eukprot:m.165629 g.165629  ORF g.165629 m.165629 type:complete len:449 (-) comp12586_c0_seq1:256-1602(-)
MQTTCKYEMDGVYVRTLDDYVSRHFLSQGKEDKAIGEVLQAIGVASKEISDQVAMASIHGTYGLKGDSGGEHGVNATGDEQKELDIMSNEVMLSALRHSGHVTIAVSEENEEPVVLRPACDTARYAVVFDPVDGSSNIECSVSVGTIFGIYRIDNVNDPELESNPASAVLRAGHEMVAAGYILYSTATFYNFSVGGKEVRSFVLDPRIGEYIQDALRSPLHLPKEPKRILSFNGGNAGNWNKPTSAFVEWAGRQAKAYSHRYIGSMVADVHRTMLYGGIFFYPADRKSPKGKLRLLYECFPMAYLVEASGGKASMGGKRILDLVPTEIHERCPIYIGSKRDVDVVDHIFQSIPNDFVDKIKPDATLPGYAVHATEPQRAPSSPLGAKARIMSKGGTGRPINSSASTTTTGRKTGKVNSASDSGESSGDSSGDEGNVSIDVVSATVAAL